MAIGWSQPSGPQVWLDFDPPVQTAGQPPDGAGHQFGPLHAQQSRPIELLQLGPITLPWAINGHTGGHADWLSLVIYQVTNSTAVVQAAHVLLGLLLLGTVHRFLITNANPTAAGIGVMVLATNWSFLFYKKVLGGTEIFLQAAVLACLWGIWSRRWRGGKHGPLLLGVGIGLGIGAKLSFGITVIALFFTTLVMRWDKPAIRPPLPRGLWKPLLAILLLSAPVWISILHHHMGLPNEPRIRSHDFAGVQWERIWGGLDGKEQPARETLENLGFWLGDPMGFYRKAYGATGGGFTPWHAIGWCIVGLGAILGWRDRHPTPRTALLRFCTVFVVVQTALLFWIARDLHHLAQTTPVLAIVAGLAIEQIVALRSPRHSYARLRLASLLTVPTLVTGIQDLWRTDAVMRTIDVPTWTASGQADLQQMLRKAEVERLVVSDYESYGLLEVLLPEVQIEHAWGAASREHGDELGLSILDHAAGGHLLVVKASAPMIYSWPRSALSKPDRDRRKLQRLAQIGQLTVEEVAQLPGDRAILFQVRMTED